MLIRLFEYRRRLNEAAQTASGPLTLLALLGISIPPLVAIATAGGEAILLSMLIVAAGVPVAYLWTNPDLDPVWPTALPRTPRPSSS